MCFIDIQGENLYAQMTIKWHTDTDTSNDVNNKESILDSLINSITKLFREKKYSQITDLISNKIYNDDDNRFRRVIDLSAMAAYYF